MLVLTLILRVLISQNIAVETMAVELPTETVIASHDMALLTAIEAEVR